MNSPFSGGTRLATVIDPVTLSCIIGFVDYSLDEDGNVAYLWQSAHVRHNYVKALPTIAEMAQIARFLDNGGGIGASRQSGAMAQLKSYIYLMALAYKFAPVVMAEAA